MADLLLELKQQKQAWETWETNPELVNELRSEIAPAPEVEPEVIAPTKPGTSPRYQAYLTTLKEGDKPNTAGFNTFVGDMKTAYDEAGKLAPSGTITNANDFTQFIQSQVGQKVPLTEIKLTRKIKGKDGKIKVAQVQADVVLRQTRKKRTTAVNLLRCVNGS